MRGIKEGAGDNKGKLTALVQENNNRLEMISTGEWKQKSVGERGGEIRKGFLFFSSKSDYESQ